MATDTLALGKRLRGLETLLVFVHSGDVSGVDSALDRTAVGTCLGAIDTGLADVERELRAFEGETAERTGTATTPREWSRSPVERLEQVPGELIGAYIYQVRALLALMRTVIEADRAEDPVLYVGMESAIELLATAGDIVELVTVERVVEAA